MKQLISDNLYLLCFGSATIVALTLAISWYVVKIKRPVDKEHDLTIDRLIN